MQLPLDFTNRMKEYLGSEYDSFIESYEKPEVKGIRLCDLALGEIPGAFLHGSTLCKLEGGQNDCTDQIEIKPVPWTENGYYFNESQDFRPGKSPYHEAGAYYMQEPSAMAPAVYLDIKPGDRVLDLCASPGGKSTQAAAFLRGEGILISNEINSERAKILSENIERMGVRNALVISEDPRNISGKFEGYFDKIIVDAPCSGEGMFRRSEVAIEEWSLDNVIMCAERQAWILDEAAKMLAPGGRLVYSTCTFAKEEDEEQIKAFLDRHDDFEYCEMKLYGNMKRGFDEIGVRLWPHLIDGEGHFVCALEKKGESSEGTRKAPPPCGYEIGITQKEKVNLKEMFEFLDETLNAKGDSLLSQIAKGDRRLTKFKDQVYLLPQECPSLKGIRVLRPGLHLGTMLKDRFEPAHALAMALNLEEINKKCVLLDGDIRAYKYINGETFEVNEEKDLIFSEKEQKKTEKNTVQFSQNKGNDKYLKKKNKEINKKNGYYVILIEKYTIGWGKYANFMMKNHYPKGLRRDIM